MMQSTNPVLRNTGAFDTPGPRSLADLNARAASSNVMTLSGTINKSLILIGVCGVTAVLTFSWLSSALSAPVGLISLGSMLGALVLGLIVSFKPTTAPLLAPVYALVQGAFLAAVSLLYANLMDARVQSGAGVTTGSALLMQAILLTVGVALAMLIAYATGLIRATPLFTKVVVAAVGGVIFFFITSLVLSLVGVDVSVLHMGPIGIGIAAVIVIVAALSLVLDFALIEDGAKAGAPKYMEWFGGFALLASLVFLYVSILRLLAVIAMSRE